MKLEMMPTAESCNSSDERRSYSYVSGHDGNMVTDGRRTKVLLEEKEEVPLSTRESRNNT